MRLAIIGLTLALTASVPLAATAQAPVSTPPLAQGEVLLEVNALGLVMTRADKATLTFNVSASGETEAEARAASEDRLREVRTRLRALGTAEADIRVQPMAAYPGGGGIDMMAVNATMAVEEYGNAAEPMDTNSVPMSLGYSASAQVQVTIRAMDRVADIQRMLTELSIYVSGAPEYALNDDSSPRRQARAQAMQKARADAEAYALSLNMRVARVVRVTERIGLDGLGLLASEGTLLGGIFNSAALRGLGPDVPTFVVVGVDYALAPR